MPAPPRAALAAALALAACAGGRAGAGPRSETGLASYYGDDLQGRPTASGQPYDARRLTCAHRSHPFGARLEVTNLQNGRKVRVRVNDRGPFVEGRVVDLSREAARRLGILGRGLVQVRVVRVR
ncbi:MAG TPA: septal ring lytic transglycosylase RlpA family protein [Anaeromyxobacteraceae bacterium]